MRWTRALGHAAAAVMVLSYVAGTPAMAQTVLGKTRHELDGRRASLCAHETALGNVVANAMKEMAPADAAIINCAAIQGERTFAAGAELSAEDTKQILPQGKIAVVEVTGVELLTLLEQAFSTRDPVDGRFPQLAGIRLQIDPNKPAGQRIVKLTVNGEALDFTRNYRLATTDELAGGGLGYSALATAKPVIAAAQAQGLSDALAAYIQKEGELDVKVYGRIQLPN
ncbi:MAG: 5'-nucleotidase C-terminal domain-containing protein [Proteobacteria bacterium]|nr:5'-nucleotidase C-terminal domain-containing protein [Pseudomonadota bacterium]